MRHAPYLVFGAWFAAMAACSPACTPPEAKAPETGKAPEASPEAKAGSPNAASEHEQRRKALPQGEMLMEAPGVDLSKLSEAQRTSFFQLINTEPSACDKPHSMARSLKDDPDCRDSLVLSQFVADAIASGAPTSAIKHDMPLLVDSLKPKKIDIEGRPVYGNPRAPVTVVVFADFQCPHCKAEAPLLRQTIDQFRDRARLIYKHFPLSGHDRARAAAVVSEEALAQGKFWALHDLVFANQDKLTPKDLRKYAAQAGLDMNKLDAALKIQKGKAQVDKDKAEGEKLGITATPAVFVNGRLVNQALFGGTLAGWIDDALKR